MLAAAPLPLSEFEALSSIGSDVVSHQIPASGSVYLTGAGYLAAKWPGGGMLLVRAPVLVADPARGEATMRFRIGWTYSKDTEDSIVISCDEHWAKPSLNQLAREAPVRSRPP